MDMTTDTVRGSGVTFGPTRRDPGRRKTTRPVEWAARVRSRGQPDRSSGSGVDRSSRRGHRASLVRGGQTRLGDCRSRPRSDSGVGYAEVFGSAGIQVFPVCGSVSNEQDVGYRMRDRQDVHGRARSRWGAWMRTRTPAYTAIGRVGESSHTYSPRGSIVRPNRSEVGLPACVHQR